MKILLIKITFLFLLAFSLRAEVISRDDFGKDVTHKIQVITEGTNTIEPERVYTQKFKASNLDEIKIGYSNDRTIFRFKVSHENGTEEGERGILSFDNALSGRVQVYRSHKGGLEYLGETGSAIAYRDRLVKGMSLAIPISFRGGDIILVRSALHRFDTRVKLYSESDYYQEQGEKRGAYFFYAGAVISLIIYSLFLFFSTKEKNYLFYSLFCFAIFLDVITIVGLFDYVVAPLGVSVSPNLIRFSCLASLSAFYFAISFTQSFSCKYWVLKYLKFLMLLSVLVALMSLEPWSYFFGKAYLGYVIDFIVVSGILSMIYLAIRRFIDGVVSAKFYLLSWLFMFIGVFAYMGHYIGIFPRVAMTSHGLMWGNLLEMLVVSFGLAYKINVLDREKAEALLLAKGRKGYERMARVLLHDLNNPLLLIQHYVKMKFNHPENFLRVEKKAWDKINFSLEKLNEIIEHYRKHEISIQRAQQELKQDEISLCEAFEDVKIVFEERLAHKKLKLSVNLNPHHDVYAERVTLINEVLCNVVSNAIKFSNKGGSITVHSEERGEWLDLIIRDDGVGISSAILKNLQEEDMISPQVGTQGERGLGFGLGLVASYMQQYGGSMEILNEEQTGKRGTHVILTFRKVL